MAKNKKNRFSRPIPLKVSLFEKQSDRIPDNPGVYRITADKAACCGKWAAGIPRWWKRDPHRILVIGTTGKSLKGRIKAFWNCQESLGNHSEGNLLLLVGGWDKITDHLKVSWIVSDNADEIEKDELWKYIRQYGEAPPLNSALPGRKEQGKMFKTTKMA